MLITRQSKGSKLNIQEMDNNLLYLENLALYKSGGTLKYVIVETDDDILNIQSLESGITFLIDYHIDNKIIFFPNNSTIIFSKDGKITNSTITSDNLYIDANSNNVDIFSSVIFTNKIYNNIIYPEWFASSISISDWSNSIQYAINLAFMSGAIVSLSSRIYSCLSTINVFAGVSIIGSGNGEDVFSAGPTKGSIIRYNGNINTSAIEIKGRFVKIRDLVVIGNSRFNGTVNGVYINAVGDGSDNSYLLENIEIENIVIHSCKTGMLLEAGNNGAITYSQFKNIRIRDCKNHILINALGARPEYGNIGSTGSPFISDSAFINSNHWNGLFCSGYAEKVLHIISQKKIQQINSQDIFVPANDLSFNHVVIEPPISMFGYIKLEGGSQVIMRNVRIEALRQDANYDSVPVIYLDENVHDCLFDTNQQSVTIVDKGYNNRFESTGSKSSQSNPNSFNLYENSELIGLSVVDFGGVDIYRLPSWSIEEQFVDGINDYDWRPLQISSNITISYDENIRRKGYKAIKITVPPKYKIRVHQNIDRQENILSTVKVNSYVIANNIKDVTFTYQDQITPIVSSSYSFGDDIFNGEYEPIGGRFTVSSPEIASFYRIALFCQNNNDIGGDDITFTFTEPQFVKGSEIKESASRPLLESGGLVNGLLRYNIVNGIDPIGLPELYTENNTAGHLKLPHEGCVFKLIGSDYFISRINYTNNRFMRGSKITLIFENDNVQIVSSSLLKLNKPFYSVDGSSITLFSSSGDGTWVELSRSTRVESGYLSIDTTDYMNDNILNLPKTGQKFFNITNINNSDVTIQRINDSTISRFDADMRILLQFTTPNNKIQFSNSPYISLSNNINYIPIDNDWIEFITTGDGTWFEIGRKIISSSVEYLPIGSETSNISTIITGTTMVLPNITKNIYTLINNGSPQTIARINDVIRFKAGTLLLLEFSTLTHSVTIQGNNTYITLTKSGNYTPVSGDWILLYSKGNGTWREVLRKQSSSIEQTKGLSSVSYPSVVSAGILTLPLTGENYFKLSGNVSGGTITRINETSGNRMSPGTVISIKFVDVLTNTITLVNSGYLILKDGINYTPSNNKLVRFITEGNGVWEEIGRS